MILRRGPKRRRTTSLHLRSFSFPIRDIKLTHSTAFLTMKKGGLVFPSGLPEEEDPPLAGLTAKRTPFPAARARLSAPLRSLSLRSARVEEVEASWTRRAAGFRAEFQ
ncbi:hypothetical protein NL108_018066 [Boleophthalmus pectinirostris]|nr:hypothetical protein NL108_018066 [Boleophthalmus pectinirostris]